MKKNKPLISVIIPTYNRDQLISNAIESVLNQTYTNFEVLIVDDFSNDKTKDVVDSIDDIRVKYLLNKRSKGAQGARNTGLNFAKGEWVAMLDSDDVWLENKLEKQIEFIKRNHSIVGVGCSYATFNFNTNRILKKKIKDEHIITENDLLYENVIGGMSVIMFNKKVAISIGGFDEQLEALQDLDFYIRLQSQGVLKSVSEILVYRRKDNKDRLSVNYKKKYEATLVMYSKHYQKISKSIVWKNKYKGRLFLYSYLDNDRVVELNYLLWFLLGAVIDTKYFFRIMKTIVLRIYKKCNY